MQLNTTGPSKTTTTTTTTTRKTTITTQTATGPTSRSDFIDLKNQDDFFSEVESDTGTLTKLEDSSSSMSIGEYFSIEAYPDPYCEIVNKMPTVCLELGLLELWAHDGNYNEVTDKEIAELTQQSILDKINSVNKSGVYLVDKNFVDYLGGVTFDANGKVIGAQASVIRWFGKCH